MASSRGVQLACGSGRPECSFGRSHRSGCPESDFAGATSQYDRNVLAQIRDEYQRYAAERAKEMAKAGGCCEFLCTVTTSHRGVGSLRSLPATALAGAHRAAVASRCKPQGPNLRRTRYVHNGTGGCAFAAMWDLRLIDCRAAGRASRSARSVMRSSFYHATLTASLSEAIVQVRWLAFAFGPG